ncbi:MAG: DNA polymerase III subunit epsilon [Alphaproteobacteria bacterium]|nr:DNA polymerase III subunit epsilon [Alphaproteobacteria bacterium]
MREIVLDTETTGLNPEKGDRIVEIGCVELENHLPTGKTYHQYINPMRSISQEVVAVHGLTEEFLSDKPIFSEIADEFLAFVGENTPLVIHNAAFDMNFLNTELKACGKPILSENNVIDTLLIARKKFPGAKVNLDELCKKFNVDASRRTVHGALLDSELLADVYLELITNRELNFSSTKKNQQNQNVIQNLKKVSRETFPIREWKLDSTEEQAHTEFLAKVKNPIWGEQ